MEKSLKVFNGTVSLFITLVREEYRQSFVSIYDFCAIGNFPFLPCKMFARKLVAFCGFLLIREIFFSSLTRFFGQFLRHEELYGLI